MASVLETVGGLEDAEQRKTVQRMVDAYNKRLNRIAHSGYEGALPSKMSYREAAEIISEDGIGELVAITASDKFINIMQRTEFRVKGEVQSVGQVETKAPSKEAIGIVQEHINKLREEAQQGPELRRQIQTLKEAWRVQQATAKEDPDPAVRAEAREAARKIWKEEHRLVQKLQIAGQPLAEKYLQSGRVSRKEFADELKKANKGYSLNTMTILKNLEQEMRELGGKSTRFTEYALSVVYAILNDPKFKGKITDLMISDLFKDITESVYDVMNMSVHMDDVFFTEAETPFNNAVKDMLTQDLNLSESEADEYLNGDTVVNARLVVGEMFNGYPIEYSSRADTMIDWYSDGAELETVSDSFTPL